MQIRFEIHAKWDNWRTFFFLILLKANIGHLDNEKFWISEFWNKHNNEENRKLQSFEKLITRKHQI